MLFNSPVFIFLFLPICLAGYFALGRHHRVETAFGWLVVCSLFFYGWWNPAYLGLIFASIAINYSLGQILNRSSNYRKALFIGGVIFNLGLLGYYKYANFFIDSLNWVVSGDFHLETIILPLAISFFTFQQVSYLIDTYRGETEEYNFLHYCLFVTFFPQLIAGPIVHHKEMLPQFMRPQSHTFDYRNISIGLTIFLMGLFKKTVLADGIAPHSTIVFNAAEAGTQLTFLEAWGGVFAYHFQIYFDFSGYSDMAIGLSRMFGIKLPLNFFSPFKTRNISDFWRQWHMTLSRFLRDYLYIALGGSRVGEFNRYRNLFLTMLLGGLWHGAAWTYVVWGALQGLFLVLFHLWHSVLNKLSFGSRLRRLSTPFAYLLTFLAIMVSWVFFRSDSFDSVTVLLKAMSGMNGIMLNDESEGWASFFTAIGFQVEISAFATRLLTGDTFSLLMTLALITYCCPNIYQWMAKYEPALDESRMIEKNPSRFQWNPSKKWSVVIAILGTIALINMNKVSEFLYFQF